MLSEGKPGSDNVYSLRDGKTAVPKCTNRTSETR